MQALWRLILVFASTDDYSPIKYLLRENSYYFFWSDTKLSVMDVQYEIQNLGLDIYDNETNTANA